MENRDLKMAEKIAACVADKGGRTFLVGGYVRDLLMGKHSKDIDIEIHGVQPKELENILDGLGSRTEMGASFGVYGLRGYDIDIAMPRQEEATGRGHKDFKIYVDPFLGTYKAAMRRDFTINAMMQDVLTGEIIDHFGGQEDLKKGVLRHVNPHTFAEDPLRVLRAAQFAARFSFSIAPETIELSQTMDLTTLAHERVMSELEKALLKAAHPSIFFEQMHKMNQLDDWFLHLTQLIGVKQPKKYHPEGDVWNHTMQVLDSAALLRSKAENPLGFMLTAVVHDFGKIISTTEENGEIHSYEYNTPVRGDVDVAEVILNQAGNFKIVDKLPGNCSMISKDVWGIKTLQFTPVSVVCYSPNYWDEQKGIGHQHLFFMLKDCINPEEPNGYYNEFLKPELEQHRRVFEALGAKAHVKDVDDQLSGVGFSLTKRNDLIIKVKGATERVLKIKF